MNTPGSPNFTAPWTRKLMAKRVLPQPAPPQMSVGRPVGRPPAVIWSKPSIPVGDLGRVATTGECYQHALLLPPGVYLSRISFRRPGLRCTGNCVCQGYRAD